MKDIKYVVATWIASLLNVPRRSDLNFFPLLGGSTRARPERRSYRSTSTPRKMDIAGIRNSVKKILAEVLRDIAATVAPFGGKPYEKSADRSVSMEVGRPTEYATGSYDVPMEIPAEVQENSIWAPDTISPSVVTTGTESLEPSDGYEMDGTGYGPEPLCRYHTKLASIDVKEIAREARSLLVDINRPRRTMISIPCRYPE